jgi:hypothetical protein
MVSLGLYGRPTGDEPWLADLTHVAQNWQRTTKAIGGYWLGSFTLSADDMSPQELASFYHSRMGCVIQEYTAGAVSWEGLIIDMRLVIGGMEQHRSLTPEWTHNKVKVRYTWPDVDAGTDAAYGSYGGGTMSWDPNSPQDGFGDTAMDFTPFATTPNGTTAGYRFEVEATDGTIIWGFMGALGSGGSDEIDIYEDIDLSDEGWAVDHVPGGRTNKTPDSWIIENMNLAGTPQETGWSENTDSSEEYGEIQYIETVGAIPTTTAEVLRDRHLAEYAWPRSRLIGTAMLTGAQPQDQLIVNVAGFFHTLNWKYLETSRVASCDDLIDYLVTQSEFVTMGRFDYNEHAANADCDPVAQRLGDLCEDVIALGDESGDMWKGGIYRDREFIYEEAPTTVEYYLLEGQLVNILGQPMIPSLVEPGFLLRVVDKLIGAQPTGTSDVWDDPAVAYVAEVEFAAPDKLRLRIGADEASIITLEEQIKAWGGLRG